MLQNEGQDTGQIPELQCCLKALNTLIPCCCVLQHLSVSYTIYIYILVAASCVQQVVCWDSACWDGTQITSWCGAGILTFFNETGYVRVSLCTNWNANAGWCKSCQHVHFKQNASTTHTQRIGSCCLRRLQASWQCGIIVSGRTPRQGLIKSLQHVSALALHIIKGGGWNASSSLLYSTNPQPVCLVQPNSISEWHIVCYSSSKQQHGC